jgi:hypothetical protein
MEIRIQIIDRLCGLVVRVLGYRSGGPGSIERHYKRRGKLNEDVRLLSVNGGLQNLRGN